MKDSVEVRKKVIEDLDLIDTKSIPNSTTPNTNNHATTSPCCKRKRLEPSSLTEQEQIALAIGNSLREVNSTEADKSENSFGEEDDSESDFDNFDDESSNQSYVKSQTSQAVSEHSNSIAEHKIESNECNECNECDTNDIESTSNAIETFENYLGDESGMCFCLSLLFYSDINHSFLHCFPFLFADPKARLQLRLPNGDRHIFEWPCSAKLKALKLYIPFKYPELTADNAYKVICPFVGGQSNNVLDMDEILTLKEANLFPSVILHLRNDD